MVIGGNIDRAISASFVEAPVGFQVGRYFRGRESSHSCFIDLAFIVNRIPDPYFFDCAVVVMFSIVIDHFPYLEGSTVEISRGSSKCTIRDEISVQVERSFI